MTIHIKKSATADSRTCDYAKVSEAQLKLASEQHIADVRLGLDLLCSLLGKAGAEHDEDKLSALQKFHADFITGFAQTGWWDKHRRISRHHLQSDDGIPDDVNLIDVLEMIVDCVMAGMARKGVVYPVEIDHVILLKAFNNTVEIIKSQVVVDE